MCGIAGVWGEGDASPALAALAHRGPDAAAVERRGQVELAHTRLAILDLDERSNQPFHSGQVLLVYNGELWNYRELRDELGGEWRTDGDTEVVARAIAEWGEDAFERFEGMFALAWTKDGQTVGLARDRFGEMPLHFGRTSSGWAFASELKGLRAPGVRGEGDWVRPGEIVRLTTNPSRTQWYVPPTEASDHDLSSAAGRLRELIAQGAQERSISDVPVCTLLSGGIDSAAVAYHLREHIPGLVAYTAVMSDRPSKDLKFARETAEMLDIELRVVEVPDPSPADLQEVIRIIEQPHKAQVEIGYACLHLARTMAADGFKVTFSGEGSDELWASYGFAYHALAAGADWHEYRRDLFVGQHRKNFARCNKVFMAHSVECRLPFLHTPLVEHALSLKKEAVQDGKAKPKAVIQRAYEGLVPSSVTGRAKLAFQDGADLKAAAEDAVSAPSSFYQAEFRKQVGSR